MKNEREKNSFVSRYLNKFSERTFCMYLLIKKNICNIHVEEGKNITRRSQEKFSLGKS